MREGLDDIQCIFQSMGARGSIYISNFPAAQNLPLLQSKGIKAVLSVARSGLLTHNKQDVPYYLYIPMEDHQDYQISKYFSATYDFIERARRQSNVLIHCMVGVSRSVTIAIAYLLRKYQYTLAQVISLIQRKRRKINPNPGFLEQLQKYSETLGIKCDFHQKKVPPIRQNSASRQVRAYSMKKQRSPLKIAEPLTPTPHVEKEESMIITTNEDLRSNNIKLQGIDLKKIKCFEEKGKEEGSSSSKRLGELKGRLDLKKSISIDEGKERKRSSIEEKISKIREKILKTQHLDDAKPSVGNYLKLKENSFTVNRNDPTRTGQDLALNRHRNIHTPTKIQDKSIRTNRQDYAQTQTSHIRNYLYQDTNKELFSTELKIEAKAFYSNGCRQNPRFLRPKQELAL